MTGPMFFPVPAPMALGALSVALDAALADPAMASREIVGIAPLESAGPGDLAFLDNAAYARFATETRAGACLIAPKFAGRLAPGTAALITAEPYRAFARATALLFPSSTRPQSVFGTIGIAAGAFVHPTARLEAGVTVDPGAVIGPGAEIGRGTLVAAHAVIGPEVRIGRDCAIGPHASITHALIGNRVIIHAGARIGQDGFGFALGARGHLKVPQIGRVILQDDVDIGANTTVDRGANRDTIIGEGSKIDNLVQIGHNVVIGRHCVIVGQAGVSGSSVLEDYAVLAGQAGIAGHVRIGMGAQVGAKAGVMADVPAGARIIGAPAKPVKQFFREVATLERLAQKGPDTREKPDQAGGTDPAGA
ncbi:MAG: UDP-3-O-(3-hydroxymyristoyl)glucosamine N-acyltransferase [Hyphomicrobiales bacterium]|uniref:UDP-3-O-(3-hydroxymyristoyl)glucosamine N-acyltransferase n=1 Tax=Rhabdaerophilum calidifontis TaxID=2604328 RepID=UPI00123A2FB8|nr:UDP-3-O-(3-hydroxymyristoyl)glucosamine N-acyltransferase [Rhabdaerophilum calidifontis]MCA1951960.1 UDP-3-O-(3-hydroxymyristoyl)glucosamine N-acyltransferase [Hyphomicrobiales bacterium]MCA1998837.1 UDP-3-O-(3-hydroxymyristoyl)glucosamine N-acyltransferase [Hyphomicrobiales bacterium]